MSLAQKDQRPDRSFPRLLAVDDDVMSAELVVRVAERCGFEGFATSDSRGVLNLCAVLNPAVLVVDVCMPNIDAIELFALLAEAGFAGRILIVSGLDQAVLRETQARAADKGLATTQFLQKPVDLPAMRAILLAEAASVRK